VNTDQTELSRCHYLSMTLGDEGLYSAMGPRQASHEQASVMILATSHGQWQVPLRLWKV
jgi:hypothetical protein